MTPAILFSAAANRHLQTKTVLVGDSVYIYIYIYIYIYRFTFTHPDVVSNLNAFIAFEEHRNIF